MYVCMFVRTYAFVYLCKRVTYVSTHVDIADITGNIMFKPQILRTEAA
jgi:hypothetical protein